MRAKKKSGFKRFAQTAKLQFTRSCIPTCAAVAASVVITKLGIGVIPVALVGTGALAWMKGYRVCITRPVSEEEPTVESENEGGQD